MPKPFTSAERKKIGNHLHEAGLKAFAAHGLRGARISDIAAAAGIAKGSFYAFFASKEELLMAIGAGRDAVHRAEMSAFLNHATGNPDTVLSEFFDFLMARITTDPLLKILQDRGEISLLMRKVSPVQLAEKAERDRAFLEELSALLKNRHAIAHATPTVLEGTMTLMICLATQAPFIAGPAYGACTNLLREMFISRLTGGIRSD
jgi:AcrR family transcriptional regulator